MHFKIGDDKKTLHCEIEDDKKLLLGQGCQESIDWLEIPRINQLVGHNKKLLEGWS